MTTPSLAAPTTSLLRPPASVVWLVLLLATALLWLLGTIRGFIGDARIASVVIMVVAFVKVRFVALYFVEFRDAPLPLRLILEEWCVVRGRRRPHKQLLPCGLRRRGRPSIASLPWRHRLTSLGLR